MRKIFNLRVIFLAFVGIFTGAFVSLFVLSSALWVKILLGIIFGALFGLCFSRIAFFSFRKIAILVTLISLLFGFSYSAIKISIYNSQTVDEEMLVTGTVTDKIKNYDTCKIVILKNVKSQGGKLSGDLQLTVYAEEAEGLSCGSELSFVSEVKSYPITKSGTVNASIEKSGVKYFASVNFDQIAIKQGSPTFFENIRISSRSLILENTKNEEIGNLIYSVIFGDKTYLSSETYNVFSLSGTAHMLAVSGLHVGFIALLILFFLGLIKAKKIVKLVVIFAFLVFYNILCGFSSSVLRASIMTVFLLLSYLFGEKYDGLTALGLAGILILLFRPLMAFDLGFQLSFSSVFGIICFSSKLSAFFTKIKIPKVIAEGAAVCLASTLGTLPFTAIYFNKLAYIGIFANILVIPIFGVIYCMTFVIFLFALLFPVIAKAYVVSEIGFIIIYKICQVFALVAPLRVTRISFLVLLVYPFSMFLTEFAFIMEKVKKHLAVILFASLSLTFALSLIPEKLNGTVFAKLETNSSVIINRHGEMLVVTQNFNSYEIEKTMDYLYKNNLEKSLVGIIVTDKASDLKDVYTFADKHTTNIYVNKNNIYDIAELKNRKNIILSNKPMILSTFEVIFYDFDYDNVCAVSVDVDDFCILFLNNLTNHQINLLNLSFENSKVDVCVCNNYQKSYNNLEIEMDKFIASKSSVEKSRQVYLTNENRDLVYAVTNKKVEERDEIC